MRYIIYNMKEKFCAPRKDSTKNVVSLVKSVSLATEFLTLGQCWPESLLITQAL